MGKNNDDTHDPLIQYPGELAKIRAFVFALTAGERNTSAFNAANFCAGLTRYGVESPVPCVSMRCQLYGNPKYIMDHLREAEEQYGKYKIKIHMKRYSEREENKRQQLLQEAKLKVEGQQTKGTKYLSVRETKAPSPHRLLDKEVRFEDMKGDSTQLDSI